MPATEHRVRTSRRGPVPAISPVVRTVRLSEAIAAIDEALGYRDLDGDRVMLSVDRAEMREALIMRLERDARR